MKYGLGLMSLLLWAGATHAAANDKAVVVSGRLDGVVPGWSIHTEQPDGWTQDCCVYAKAIGVNLVLYKGEWSGEPDRVMVLNVWPAKLATLDAELQEDRKHYLQLDPAGKVAAFPLLNAGMPCQGVLYQGNDHKDDAVVFCDPGKASGIRLSWSMTLAHDDASRQDLLSLFKRVVEQSRYIAYQPPKDAKDKVARH
ncbi:MAG TPA: hypothetical protein VGI53_09880 [Dyella sp.]